MIQQNHFTAPGAKDRGITLDITYDTDKRNAPLVIFAHGFKGYKDWGTHNLVARHFARNGFRFLKFNFSHNGTTPDELRALTDMEAFSNNTFSIELTDLRLVTDFVFSGSAFAPAREVYLVGHSMGGGVAVIHAAEDKRIKKLVTMAGVANFRNLWPRAAEKQWRLQGIMHFPNQRTGQQMPVKSTLLDDLDNNPERLNIILRATQITQPWLIAHGDADTTVTLQHAEELHAANPEAELFVITGGDHVFSGKEPWMEQTLPPHLLEFCNTAIAFLNK